MIEVICLTYGEPENPKWVEQFQYSLNILKRLTRLIAPIPRILLPIIAAKRAFQRCRIQRSEGFHSPLESISKQFGSDLEYGLKATYPELTFRVQVAHEFREPQFLKLLEAIDSVKTQKVLILPLYLADSTFTSGISKSDFGCFKKKFPLTQIEVAWISCPNGDALFADVVAKHIMDDCENLGLQKQDLADYHLVLGAHGTLIEPSAGIKNGLAETLAHRDELLERLGPVFAGVHLGWLNHTRGGTWTEPEMKNLGEILKETAKRGILYYPAGFLADNSETMLEGPALLENLQELQVLPCLNNSPALVDYMIDRMRPNISKFDVVSISGNEEQV